VSVALHKAEASEMLLRLAAVAQRSLDELYLLRGPSPDLELDQAGLRDGAKIIADYINHNELGLAFEHLFYMLIEPKIVVPRAHLVDLETVGRSLGFAPALWQPVRVRQEG
jgi:hypothetical protein